jgi:hypothetical protein
MVIKIYDKRIKELGKSYLDNLKIFYSPVLKCFVKYSFSDKENRGDLFLIDKFYFGDISSIGSLEDFVSYIRNTYGYDL